MILAEKQIVRTPVEDILLREMVDEDKKFVSDQDECTEAVDEFLDTDPGLFDNEDDLFDLDDDIDDDIDDVDLFD